MSELVDASSSPEKVEQTEEPTAKHGVGDRKQYYNKWDKLAKDEEKKLEEEEEEAKKRKEEAEKHIPLSDAHKKDTEKRKELAETKKEWDGVKALEEARKFFLQNESGKSSQVFTFNKNFENSGVLMIKHMTDCDYTFTNDTGKLITKIFVETCVNCTFSFSCKIVTSSIELSRCKNVNIRILEHATHTIQIDLSSDMHVFFGHGLMDKDTKIYHSGVKNLRIDYDHLNTADHDKGKEHWDTKYQELDDFDLSLLNEQHNTSSNKDGDQQFVTAYHKDDLITDVVLRDKGGHPMTLREIEERKKAVEDAARRNGIDINCEAVQRLLHEYDPATPVQTAIAQKDEGNKAFKDANYAQASVYYTQALESLNASASDRDSAVGQELRCTLFSNRAACQLKLGDHEKALLDADKALALDSNHVKSHFRRGLAMHAKAQYKDACISLGAALKLEPKNDQVRSALMFAERKLEMEMRNAMKAK